MSHVTEQIEREVESTRAHLDQTMEALREKMSLGQIMDETVRFARESGGAEMMSNLGAQVRANPIPLALVGLGLAWLMSGRGQPAMSSAGDSAGEGLGHRASHAASSVGEGARSSFARVGEAASSTGESMGRAARRAGESASWASRRTAQGARAMSERARRGFFDILEEEPLIIGAAGVALGAAIGALLPATETEDRYLGEQRDKIKHDVAEAAGEEWGKTTGAETESPLAASSGPAGSGMAATSEQFSHEEPPAYTQSRYEDHIVDLNTAPREILEELPMVGPERAQKLMDRRPFHNWEEIEQVPGFNKAMVDDLKSGGAQLGTHA